MSMPVDGMAPTRILLVRHGETDWNVESRIQGFTDIPLNHKGRAQARHLAGRLADMLDQEPVQAVYASDLQRAFHTAQALAEVFGLTVRPEQQLRERHFGHFEGCTFKEIEERWPQDAARWRSRDPDFGPQGGETLAVFYQRCVDAASRLASAHLGQTIALVAHGGVLDSLYRAATRTPVQAPRAWTVANATLNRLAWTPEGFSLLLWNDATHLSALDDPST